ncbi:VWA domain-containing protein [Candidatus Sumerlaeota bacterium]|nr:VWA domain-containing protein [Candidatus Sumerlaeota bacterium]
MPALFPEFSPMRFRILSLLVLLLFSAAAANARIIIVPPPERPLPAVSITSHSVKSEIDGVVARTVIRETIRNDSSQQLEGSFLIPVPKDAQVTDFSMTINGQKSSAELLDSRKARDMYDQIVRRRRDPGLLEYLDENTYRVSIFPVPPGDKAEVEIHLLQNVSKESGLYRWRFRNTGDTAEEARTPESTFEVSLKSDQELGLITSTTHEARIDRGADGKSATISLPKGLKGVTDFELLYAIDETATPLHLAGSKAPGDDRGYYLLMVSPPRSGVLAQTLPKRVLFVLDVSGSMEEDGKFDKAISALRQCLSNLGDADQFNVITFASELESFRPAPIAASREAINEAKDWLQKRSPRGGTNIHDALQEAMKQLASAEKKAGTVNQIVFMTDGIPTVGRTDKAQIVDLVSKEAPTVFTLGFGYDVNAPLLDAVAEKTHAFPTYIRPKEDLERTVTGLFEAISSPVLTDLQVTCEGVELKEQYPRNMPDLFAGRELVLAGRYVGSGPATITLKGRARSEDYESKLKVDFPEATDERSESIRAIWAGRKVAYLLDEIRQHGENKELKDEVIALAREFRLVTPYTSMFAAPDEEYAMTTGGASPVTVGAAPGAREKLRDLSNEAAMKSSTGEGSFGFSDALREQKSSSIALSSQPRRAEPTRDTAAGGEIMQVDGISFRRVDKSSAWIDSSLKGDEPVVRIKYLSDAYHELLRKFPKLRSRILVGENVEVLIDGKRAVIGPDGEATKCPI